MGMPLPKSIQNAPDLVLGLELYLVGFFDLTSSRQVGWQAGAISWLAIQQYCEIMGLNEEQTEDMHYHVSRLDTIWKAHQAKRESS